MEGLWRGWGFAMIGMSKLQDISDETYIPLQMFRHDMGRG